MPFVADPDGGVVGHEWINFDMISQYLDWGETGRMIEEDLKTLFHPKLPPCVDK